MGALVDIYRQSHVFFKSFTMLGTFSFYQLYFLNSKWVLHTLLDDRNHLFRHFSMFFHPFLLQTEKNKKKRKKHASLDGSLAVPVVVPGNESGLVYENQPIIPGFLFLVM